MRRLLARPWGVELRLCCWLLCCRARREACCCSSRSCTCGKGPTVIYSYIHTSMHPYIYTSIHPYIHTSIHLYIHTDIHTFIYLYIHTSIHLYIHTFIHLYIHTFIHLYIHTFIHLYIHTSVYPYICKTIQMCQCIFSCSVILPFPVPPYLHDPVYTNLILLQYLDTAIPLYFSTFVPLCPHTCMLRYQPAQAVHPPGGRPLS